MATDRCPTRGLERADWMRREAAEWADAGRGDIAAHCLTVAGSIEERDFAGRPLLALMGAGKG
ncbi:hypothetical protein ABNQ39_00460 (plasmid) [Azospirillum sp. A26]|uniref:hypothetical protein n=1 Tax=Azospirillum sp. A26 TaxID=3160607 RepID=UPI00366C2D9F